MRLKYIIVDDEPLSQRIIEKYAINIPSLELVGKCKSAFEAMNALFQLQPDLAFLDINMPNLSGMELLKTLKNPPLVIITTAYREYALESYDYEVIDYLKKPFSFERFYKAVQKAQEKYLARDAIAFSTPIKELPKKYIFVKSEKKLIRIKLDDILYVEAYGDYIKIFSPKEMTLVLMSLKNIHQQLPSERFYRIHKSYIIAIEKIDLIEGNMVKIKDAEIPIGKSFRGAFFDLVKPQ